jgi:choline-sulfatase
MAVCTRNGLPLQQGVWDETVRELGNKDNPGIYPVTFRKRVKVKPAKEEFDLYNLSEDPMELANLAGKASVAAVEPELRNLLAQQRGSKRLTPVSGAVPGQAACG